MIYEYISELYIRGKKEVVEWMLGELASDYLEGEGVGSAQQGAKAE